MPTFTKPWLCKRLIDAIRDGFATGERAVVVDVHPRLLPFGLPCASLVLERSQQFFLLAVHRDGRCLLLLELLAQGSDMPNLLITIGMRRAFQRFLVDFERIALLVQQVGQRRSLDAMSLPRVRLDQLRQCMRRPFDQARPIPFGLQQCRQIPLQGRIRPRCLLPPTPGPAYPPSRSDSLSRELVDSTL